MEELQNLEVVWSPTEVAKVVDRGTRRRSDKTFDVGSLRQIGATDAY